MSSSSSDNLLFKVLAVLFWLASFLRPHWISCSIPAGAAWPPQRCGWKVQEMLACSHCHCSNLDLQLWSRNTADASVVRTHHKCVMMAPLTLPWIWPTAVPGVESWGLVPGWALLTLALQPVRATAAPGVRGDSVDTIAAMKLAADFAGMEWEINHLAPGLGRRMDPWPF